MCLGELALPLTLDMGELALMAWAFKSLFCSLGEESSQWPALKSSAITQTQILGLALIHPNNYPICGFLEHENWSCGMLVIGDLHDLEQQQNI